MLGDGPLTVGVVVGEGSLYSGQNFLDEVLRNLAWHDLWEELGPLSCVHPHSSSFAEL